MVDSFDWGLIEPLRTETDTGDDAILAALIDVEAALTLAWVDARYAPAWVEEISEALTAGPLKAAQIDAAQIDVRPIDRDALARGNRAGGNPVIPLVTALRAHADSIRDGAGEWVHRGATSQDILDTALMLVAARSVPALLADLEGAASALAALADTHRGSLQAGRTLTQHAAPLTFGIKAAGWLDGVEAAIAGLSRAQFPVQLAGSVGTGSAMVDLTGDDSATHALRAGLADRLKMDDPGRSWQSERSPVTQLGAALAVVLGVLGRISSDILVLARTEIGEAHAGLGGSSAMPHKQNPTAAVLVTAAAIRAPALVSTLFSSMVASDERPDGAWHAGWQPARQLLSLAREAAAASISLMNELSVDTERMASNLRLTGGLIYSEQVLSLLTRSRGLSAASHLVNEAIASGRPFADAVPVNLSNEPILRLSDSIVDASIARHREALQHRLRTQRTP